jgi:transcriptional regulator with XRE-family HTH domain
MMSVAPAMALRNMTSRSSVKDSTAIDISAPFFLSRMGTETSGVHSRRAPTHLADSREDRTLCGARPDAMRPPNLDGRSIHTSKVAQKCCIAIASAALACVNGRVRFQHDERTRTVPARRHRLAQRRKAVGLSQEALAEVMGVDRSTIVRWERAATEPQPWHRPRLARALKVSIEELAALLADVGEPSAPPSERLDYVLKHPASVDLLAVAYLRERLARLDEQYDHIPSTLLLAEAGQLYGQAVFLRERARSLVRRETAGRRSRSRHAHGPAGLGRLTTA